jgi:hypothetical protein
MKMRKIWAAQALKERENIRMKQNRQRNTNNNNRALQSNDQQTASVEIPVTSNC